MKVFTKAQLEPGGQDGTQEPASVPMRYPAGHEAAHEEAPWAEYKPAEQAWHADSPTFAYVPLGQAPLQNVAPDTEYLPAAHMVTFAAEQYAPAGQRLQTRAPAAEY